MRRIILAMTAAVLGITGCGSTQEPAAETLAEPVTEQTAEAAPQVPENNDLVIPLSEVTETARFYPVTVEGTDLVCQNCGFRFTADEVGASEGGGCSPWAISAEERTDTEDSITIPYEFLVSSKNIFANWR